MILKSCIITESLISLTPDLRISPEVHFSVMKETKRAKMIDAEFRIVGRRFANKWINRRKIIDSFGSPCSDFGSVFKMAWSWIEILSSFQRDVADIRPEIANSMHI